MEISTFINNMIIKRSQALTPPWDNNFGDNVKMYDPTFWQCQKLNFFLFYINSD